VDRYADVLGDDGIAEMRRLAEERWAAMPERCPVSGSDTTPGRFHLERMMEKLAVQAGDVDGHVAVMARDLAHVYDFLQIAEVLAAPRRSDDALEWAQRGLIAFADDERVPDPRLDDFILAPTSTEGGSTMSPISCVSLGEAPEHRHLRPAAGMGPARRPVGRASPEGTRPAPG
jgi:hypothetical protein